MAHQAYIGTQVRGQGLGCHFSRRWLHRTKFLGNRVDCLVERRSGEVGITGCCVRLRVAEKRADHWQAQSARGVDAREAMSQVMQAEVVEAGGLAKVLPRYTNRTNGSEARFPGKR